MDTKTKCPIGYGWRKWRDEHPELYLQRAIQYSTKYNNTNKELIAIKMKKKYYYDKECTRLSSIEL